MMAGMGHEVLSSRGDAGPAPGAAGRGAVVPAEVVELDDVATAPDVPAPAPGRASWWRTRVVQLLAVAVAAAWLGGALVQQRAADERAREVSSTLAASATVIEMSDPPRSGSDPDVDVVMFLTARVRNYGPAPVSVDEIRGAGGRTVGKDLRGQRTVPAGGSLLIPVQLRVPCGAGAEPPLESVSLTTEDGRAHEVPLTYPYESSSVEGFCPELRGEGDVIDVSAVLTGTTDRPVLRVISRSSRPVTLELGGFGSFDPDQPYPALRMSTRPRLPLRLAPGGRADIVLQLTSEVCVRDVTLLRPASVVMLRASAADGDATSVELTGLDALAGAAAARACAAGAR